MIPGIPVFDVVQLAKLVIKLIIFGTFVGFFLIFAPDIKNLLVETSNRAFSGSFTALDGLDLGCFAGLIGLDIFLSALWNSFYLAVVFYISGIATILGMRYSITFVGILMRV